MASFKCPQCHAEVTKGKGDGVGCPCCGYASENAPAQVTPYYPFPIWIAPYPWWAPNPYQPTWIGDGAGTVAPSKDPNLTWETTSNTFTITADDYTKYKITSGNGISFGQATA